MESILTSIKKSLGIGAEYTHFDDILVFHINSVFSILTQLGVGPSKGFSISDSSAAWDDYIPNGETLQFVKTYMSLKVKLIFDPPLVAAVLEAAKAQISELEWRIQVAAETENTSGGDADPYTGEYEVVPKAFSSQTLETANKVLDENIVVAEVPYFETSNTSAGKTAYIAREGNLR